jgi:RHS repeat-associated protein
VSSSAAIYVLHDQQGTPLGMVRGGTSYAFVTDNIGSVTAIVDSSGSTDATYTYDPYGTVLSGNGSLAPANLLSYTGALTDISSGNATGYTHDGNRWYDTATGAFTTQDTSTHLASPANGNRYAYAADNPTNYTDPTGNSVCGYAIAGLFTLIGLGVLFSGVGVVASVFFIVWLGIGAETAVEGVF